MLRKLRMVSALLIGIFASALFIWGAAPVAAQGILGDSPEAVQPDARVRLLVKWQGEVQIASSASLANVQSVTAMWPLDWQVLEVPASEAENVLGALSRDPSVADDTIDYPLEQAYQTNDPGFINGGKWNLDKIGADLAWEFSTGRAVK